MFMEGKRESNEEIIGRYGKKEEGIFEGIQFKYTEKEWSYIVSDTKQPKILVYSHARNPVIARENMKNLIEKIRQYQKV